MKLLLFSFLFTGHVFAHQNTVTKSGQKLYFPENDINLELVNSPSQISSLKTREIVEESLSAWTQTGTRLKLKSAPSVHKIQFENDFSRYGSSVIGVTEINFNSAGVIQKAIVKINNNAPLSASKDAQKNLKIYLGDVLSHELGHFIGLNHSEVLSSTMFYESFAGQHLLGADDVAGAKSLYSSNWGRIRGRVMGGEYIPVLGAQVKAISRKTGEAISTVSDEEGNFSIQGLELNDSYYLYISPTVRVSDLPSYYANTQSNFCPTAYKGGFFTACGVEESGSAQSIALSDNRMNVDVGVVSISCSLRSSPAYAESKLESEPDSLMFWDSFSENIVEKTQIGYFSSLSTWSNWDKFKLDLRAINPANKFLKLNLVAHMFGNPLSYEMMILVDGEEVTTVGISEDPLTLTLKTDLEYLLPLSADTSLNEIEVHIRARTVGEVLLSKIFPAISEFVTPNTQYPYLLIAGLAENRLGQITNLANDQQLLSDNVSCLDAPFTYRVAKNDVTDNERSTTQKQDGLQTPSCGTTQLPPPSSGPGSGLMSLTLGFLLSLLFWDLKKNKKTLS